MGTQSSNGMEPFDFGQVVLTQRSIPCFFGKTGVCLNQDSSLIGLMRHALDELITAVVHPTEGKRSPDAAIVGMVKVLNHLQTAGQGRIGGFLKPGGQGPESRFRQVHAAFGHNRPDSTLGHGLHRLLGMIIPRVDKAGHPMPDAVDRTQERAEVTVFCRQSSLVGIHPLKQKLLTAHFIGQAAAHLKGGMQVPINESRHHYGISSLQFPPGPILGQQRIGLAHFHDGVSLDGQRTISIDLALFVKGDQPVGAMHHQVHFTHRLS